MTKTFKIDAWLSLPRVSFFAFPPSADPVFKAAIIRKNRYDQRGRAELEMNLIWGNCGFLVQRQTEFIDEHDTSENNLT